MKSRPVISIRLALTLTASALASAMLGSALIPIQPTPAAHALVYSATLQPTPLSPSAPMGSGFTYQGSLKDGGNPANGQFDFTFSLYDSLTGGNLVSGPVTQPNQTVTNGLFTLTLDFGTSAFNGDARYLQIAVKRISDPNYTTLSPRQPLTPTPYALFALKTQRYGGVVTVARSGGDFTSIQAALDSIAGTPDARYLVWVAPGVYAETVQMEEYVDIEGAGEGVTKITFTGSGEEDTGTVRGANNAELRFLTVENTGGAGHAIAIYNGFASPRLLHVTATGFGGSLTSYGVRNFNASPLMTHVTASASGGVSNYGVRNFINSSPTMTHVTASASGAGGNYGVYNIQNSSPKMTHVIASVSGGTGNFSNGVYNHTSSPTMTDVTASASGGNTAFGVYNTDSTTTMLRVTASASGLTDSFGVYNTNSSTTMTDLTVTAVAGSGASYGIWDADSPTPMLMTNANVTASGGTASHGARIRHSSPKIQNSVISASGASNNYGVFSSGSNGSYIITIDNSTVTGSANTIRSDEEYTLKVGGSKLDGGPVDPGNGPSVCAGVYDENYTFFPNACP